MTDVAPADYLSIASRVLPHEQDETLVASILGRTAGALDRYVSDSDRKRLGPPLDQIAAAEMQQASDQGLRIVWFRGLRSLSETDASRSRLKQLLSGSLQIPGVTLRPLDRWNLVTTLVAWNDPDADRVLAQKRA